jgi:hypothetical protein
VDAVTELREIGEHCLDVEFVVMQALILLALLVEDSRRRVRS